MSRSGISFPDELLLRYLAYKTWSHTDRQTQPSIWSAAGAVRLTADTEPIWRCSIAGSGAENRKVVGIISDYSWQIGEIKPACAPGSGTRCDPVSLKKSAAVARRIAINKAHSTEAGSVATLVVSLGGRFDLVAGSVAWWWRWSIVIESCRRRRADLVSLTIPKRK